MKKECTHCHRPFDITAKYFNFNESVCNSCWKKNHKGKVHTANNESSDSESVLWSGNECDDDELEDDEEPKPTKSITVNHDPQQLVEQVIPQPARKKKASGSSAHPPPAAKRQKNGGVGKAKKLAVISAINDFLNSPEAAKKPTAPVLSIRIDI